MIPYKNRFHGHNSVSYVYRNGQTVHLKTMTIKVSTNKYRKDSRIAIVVSKKVLKSAVGRNRIRRRIYECIRLKLPEFCDIFDVIIIVSSSEVLNTKHTDLISQINQLLYKTSVIKNQ